MPRYTCPKPLMMSRAETPLDTGHTTPATLGIERKWWILISVGVGTFMSALDGSVVNTVLPVIRRSLSTSIASIEWVVTLYLLVVSGLLLSFGRLGDMRGHKPIYVSGFVAFVASSVLCGVAPTTQALVAFRALQAVGAAMLFANSPAILTKSFPATERGQALGWQATMTYLGVTVGPALGGWLAARFGWRAIFFINAPVGLLGLWLSLRFIPGGAPAGNAERFDWAGAVTWMSALAALLLSLNRGHAWGWTSPAIVCLLATAGLLVAVFVVLERRAQSPLLDLGLFQSRSFSAATASAVLNYICVYAIVFLLPFYLIQSRGLGPADTGLLITAQSVMRAIASPISGTWSDRIGSRLPAMLGMATMAFGLFLLSRLGDQTPLINIALALSLTGLGAGIFVSPNNSALMGSAPRHRQGIAAATMATARNLGMVLGVGLAGAALTTVLAHSPAGHSARAMVRAVDVGLLVTAGAAVLGLLTCAMEQKSGVRIQKAASSGQ